MLIRRLFLFALLAAALVYGVAHLFVLRFEQGDVYPPYSSLRTDPQGIKALYDALGEVPQMGLSRNFRPIVKFKPAAPTTLLYAGTPMDAYWDPRELEAVEALAKAGSRVVITFAPLTRGPSSGEIAREKKIAQEKAQARRKERTGKDGKDSKDSKDAKDASIPEKDQSDEPEAERLVSFEKVAERWGFGFAFHESAGRSFQGKAARDAEAEALEEELSWHSALYFNLKSAPWTAVYNCRKKTVIAERAYGLGSIVLAGDSYFLSNEAMLKERHPQLLSWLVGPSRALVVDEESHGVREEPGIASLVPRYGLQGAVGVLFVLAGLFLWKNSRPLVPPFEEAAAGATIVAGKQSQEGFVNLLRRSIAPKAILGVCVQEWKKAFDRDGCSTRGLELERAASEEAGRSVRQRNAAGAYNAMAAALAGTRRAGPKILPATDSSHAN